MTTVAATRGIIASDCRVHSGDACETSAPKIRRYGNRRIGIAGDYFTAARFWRWLDGGMKGKPPATRALDILVGENGTLAFWAVIGGELVKTPVTDAYAAIGTGSDVANGAMYAGKGAVTAIKAATKHDTKTGNGVRWMRYG